jgi:phosphoglycerate kinase
MSQKLSLLHLTLPNKKVLMRVDFNVPLDKEGKIEDDSRITASLPSIRHVLDQGGALILMSHLGRPKGKKDPAFSLAPCAKRLSDLLDQPVIMAPDCIGPEVQKLASELKPGQVMLLENLRFYPEEENPEINPAFAEQLAKLGDVYVNDAFGTAHRAHSSTATIARFFSDSAATGLLMEKEIQFLGEALLQPKRPFYALIGGAKVSSKFGVLQSLLKKVDGLLIGGAMAYTFFKAKGWNIGSSLYEEDMVEKARDILKNAEELGVKLVLPQDNVVASKMSADAEVRIVRSEEGIPEGFSGVDIGPRTVEEFKELLHSAMTVLWNGPLGVFEIPRFAEGTEAIAKALATYSATTIVGGGDSIAAIQKLGFANRFAHLSTGGGASLEYIEHGTLPGIEALSKKV